MAEMTFWPTKQLDTSMSRTSSYIYPGSVGFRTQGLVVATEVYHARNGATTKLLLEHVNLCVQFVYIYRLI